MGIVSEEYEGRRFLDLLVEVKRTILKVISGVLALVLFTIKRFGRKISSRGML
jgi:ABC-type sulfate transport system permease subunit